MTHCVKVVHVGGKGKVKEKRNLTPFKDLFISETEFNVALNECNTELETFKTFKIAFKNIFCDIWKTFSDAMARREFHWANVKCRHYYFLETWILKNSQLFFMYIVNSIMLDFYQLGAQCLPYQQELAPPAIPSNKEQVQNVQNVQNLKHFS